MLHETARFTGQLAPALAECWRRRSFGPCQALCAALLPGLSAYADGFATAASEPLTAQVARGLPFDRDFWRLLAGELLLFGADELPEFQTAPETLARLLAPDVDPAEELPRDRLPPVLQSHYGSRELRFGSAFYHPDRAGWNDAADVARLADYLAAVDPAAWTADSLRGLGPDEDADDELAFARDWFPPLREMYRRARERGQVVVCERIG
jgi:hypothetical protein